MFRKIISFLLVLGLVACFVNLTWAQEEVKINEYEELQEEIKKLDIELRRARYDRDEERHREIVRQKEHIDWKITKYMRSKLSLVLESNKSVYKYGDLITITAIWTNIAEEDVFVTECDLKIYNYEVREITGKKLRNHKPGMRSDSDCYAFILEPGRTQEYSQDISDRFRFKPGEYYIAPTSAEMRYYSIPASPIKITVEARME